MRYDVLEGLIDEEEDVIFVTKLKLLSIGIVDIPTIFVFKLVTFGAQVI
jgi:hypothetical protein